MQASRNSQPAVLVVDDDHSTHHLITTMLRPMSLTIFAADSGEQALAAVDVLQPDLIIVDLMQPVPGDCDGMELIQCLTQSDRGRCIPVIVFTAHPGPIYVHGEYWPPQVIGVVDKARLRPADFRALVRSSYR